MLPVKMWRFNAGVTPVYREYRLMLRMGSSQIEVPVDVRKWLPGGAV